MSEASFSDRMFEFSAYIDVYVSIVTDALNVLFYWNGNAPLFNYLFFLLMNSYLWSGGFYMIIVAILGIVLLLPLICFNERLARASSMRSFLKGSNLKVLWIMVSLFSENGTSTVGSTIMAAIGGTDSIGNIDPELAFLRRKKQDFLVFVNHFLATSKKIQFACNFFDDLLSNPLNLFFDVRFIFGCFLVSKINISYVLAMALNLALVWNWPPFVIFRGLFLYLYHSFFKFYYKRYFSTILIARHIFLPIRLKGQEDENRWYIRIPSKAEIFIKKILFVDLYDQMNHELVRILYLYETQRWWPGIGWTDMLKSTDRPRYSNESGLMGSSSLLAIEQQASSSLRNWEWIDSKWQILTEELPKFQPHSDEAWESTSANGTLLRHWKLTLPSRLVFLEPDNEETPPSFWEYSENSKSPFKSNVGHVVEDLCRLRRRVLFRRMSIDFAHFIVDFNTLH